MQVCVCCAGWGLTAPQVGGDVLQIVYLSDGLLPGEVEDQHPVARGDVLQPANVTNISVTLPVCEHRSRKKSESLKCTH